MPLSVRLPTVMRVHAGGQSSVSANGSTIAEVLDDLHRQFPNLQGQITDESGELRRFVNVFVNDEDVRFLNKLDTPVKDDDEISIVPAVAGG